MTLAFIDAGGEPRHLCQVVIHWRQGWLGMELKPATAEARLVGLTALRAFEALQGIINCQGAASDGPKSGSLGG